MADSAQQVVMESLRKILKQPAAAKEAVDAALVAINGFQGVVQQSLADANAAAIAEARGSPREKSINGIGRLLFLEFLYRYIQILKQLGTGRIHMAGVGEIGPSNFVLGHIRQTHSEAKEIESNLRRLGAIDGINSAIYFTLASHIKSLNSTALGAILAEENAPKSFDHDIERFLVYAENMVVRNILWKMLRRYGKDASFFDLSGALMDLAGDLVVNNLKSMSRVRELRELFNREQDGKPLTAYYKELYRQIRNS